MGLALEIVDLLFRILWSLLERAYRFINPMPRKKIDGEIVLITGGGGGIGECIAVEMAKLNVKIVLWDINEEAVERVAEKVRKEGATVYAFRCDLADKDEVSRVAEEVKRQVGHVTILVNNAGVFFCRKFMDCTDKELSKTVQINTTAHYWTSRAFLPHMMEINYGHIVTVASLAGLLGVPNAVGYCSSKFGAVGFHESLRIELLSMGKSGVKTTCLCPSFVDTPLLTNVKVTYRFPHFAPMKPQYVAKELVDGMLRDKSYVLVPKISNFLLMMHRLFPEKTSQILFGFLEMGGEDARNSSKLPEKATTQRDGKKDE